VSKKRLVLVRHAKATKGNAEPADEERPLSKRGRKDAAFMGGVMRDTIGTVDLLISSPAVRARETAEAVATALRYPAGAIRLVNRVYGAPVESLLSVVRDLDANQWTVALVGHNPGITLLAAALSNTEIDDLPTAGVCCITLTCSWAEIGIGCGSIELIDFPKRHPERPR